MLGNVNKTCFGGYSRVSVRKSKKLGQQRDARTHESPVEAALLVVSKLGQLESLTSKKQRINAQQNCNAMHAYVLYSTEW